MTFVAENSFLWQKIAIDINQTTTVDNVTDLLRTGVRILFLRFGLHTRIENERILAASREAIEVYSSETVPWKPVIGIACELSGKGCRLKFDRQRGPIAVAPGQRIFFTSDAKYEDGKIDSVIYVTNLRKQLTRLKPNDVIKVEQIELKVCKINGKFVQCCVRNNGGISSPLRLHPYDHLIIKASESQWKFDENDRDECLLALKYKCHYIVIPDMANHMIVHAVDELIQLHQMEKPMIRTIATLAPSVVDPCIKHNIQHVAGVITQDVDVIRQCKECCKSVLFELSDLNQLSNEDVVHHVDVFITNPDLLEQLKFSLKEINQATIQKLGAVPIQLQQKQRILSQCIEYASINCKANAIILCTPKTLCESEKLSRMKLPCPVLITTSDEDVIYYLLLRKYCFPISLPQHAKSNRQLIKCATVYGRKFGFLLPGNVTVTGFGANFVEGVELRYVPDDFMLRFQ